MLKAALAAMFLAVAAPAAAQETYVAVIVGLAGEPAHGEAFRRWAGSLVDHASTRMAIPKDRIVYLLDDPQHDRNRSPGKSTKQEIEARLGAIAATAKPDDVVFIVLIGHGTWDGKVAKFNLPGPDMTPADFARVLKGARTRNVVFANTASASGPFIDALAAEGRVIVTATRSGAEQFATLFGGYFIDALAGDAADVDRNKRVSVLEAFNAARIEVARAYEQRGIMLTERALLDDSGDGEGSLEPAVTGKDGRVASVVSLGTAASAVALPEDPRLRQLHIERQELERRAEAVKLLKSSLPPAQYAAELEKVLTDLARKTREIRALEGKGK